MVQFTTNLDQRLYKLKYSLTKLVVVPFFCVLFLFFSIAPAHANIFDDIVSGTKSFFIKDDKDKKQNELTLTSEITLASNGDINNNGKIDTGDVVQFTYNINNMTDNDYYFANLKTNIDREQINYIHNVEGTTNISTKDKTITIKNLRIEKKQLLTISFKARINYSHDKDLNLSTEPELISEDKKPIKKSSKKEIKALRINKDNIPAATFKKAD